MDKRSHWCSFWDPGSTKYPKPPKNLLVSRHKVPKERTAAILTPNSRWEFELRGRDHYWLAEDRISFIELKNRQRIVGSYRGARHTLNSTLWVRFSTKLEGLSPAFHLGSRKPPGKKPPGNFVSAKNPRATFENPGQLFSTPGNFFRRFLDSFPKLLGTCSGAEHVF